MLPRPATTRWSPSTALTGVRRPARRGGEVGAVEAVAERLRPEAGEEAVRLELGRRPEVQGAEAAGVVEGDARAALDVEDDVVVLLGRRVRVVEGAELRPGDEEPARHAEVQDQRLAAVEVGEQVLRAPPERRDPAAGEPLGQPRREGPAQVGAADLGARDDAPGKHGLEAAADRLDLRQFRHAPPPAVRLRCAPTSLIRSGGNDRKTARMAPEPTSTSPPPISATRPSPRPRRPGGCTGSSPRSPGATT